MPSFGAKRAPQQIIMLGLSGAGKTTLLYRLKIPGWKEIVKDLAELNKFKEKTDPGYHYEEMQGKPLGSYGIWDVPGSKVMISLWSTFYRYITVMGVLFVVDGSAESAKESKEFDEKLHQARRLIQFLLNEDELRGATFTLIINHRDVIERRSDGSDTVSGEPAKEFRMRMDHIKEILQVKAIMADDANMARFHVHELNCASPKDVPLVWPRIIKEIHELAVMGK